MCIRDSVQEMPNYQYNYYLPHLIICCYFTLENEMLEMLAILAYYTATSKRTKCKDTIALFAVLAVSDYAGFISQYYLGYSAT